MSAPLFDRLRELVPALGTVSGLAYADTHGTAVLGIEAQRALITALTPCACGAVAGQDCAPDCDLDAGTCDTCGAPYDAGSRDGRCGDCGECAAHCDHDANAWRCSCLCGCDSWLPALRQQTCDTCHDRCVGSGAFPAPGVIA